MKFLTLFSLLLLSLPAFAVPSKIAGVALNGTTNKPLANAQIRLVRPKDGAGKDMVATTQTDATGRFAFAPRDYGKEELLMVETRVGGFDYWKVAWDGGGRLKSAGLEVHPEDVQLQTFDTSTQSVPLTLQVHHLAISSAPDGVKCIERLVILNPSRKTLMGIGPRKVSVWINLPKNAQNVQLDPKISDAKLVKTSSGWGVVRPIPPDDYRPMGVQINVPNVLIINYDMKWPSVLPWAKSVDLSRDVAYPTKFFFVARTTEDKNLEVTAPTLSKDQETQLPIDGKTEVRVVNSIGMPMAESPALAGGTTLQISAGRPVNPIFWGFAAMVVALCLFLPLAMIKPRSKKNQGLAIKRNRKTAEPDFEGSVNEQSSTPLTLNGLGTDFALTSASRDLIVRIAELDDRREAGTIDEATYQIQRAAWKKQLIETLNSPSEE